MRSAPSVVEHAARTTEADLLVVGARYHSGVAFAFLGSVTDDLRRAAACDVLVVPHGVPS